MNDRRKTVVLELFIKGSLCCKHFLPIIYHIILYLSIISFTFFVKIYIIIIFIIIDQNNRMIIFCKSPICQEIIVQGQTF